MRRTHRTEFPEFPELPKDFEAFASDQNLVDTSWHNDESPSWRHPEWPITIWINRDDAALSYAISFVPAESEVEEYQGMSWYDLLPHDSDVIFGADDVDIYAQVQQIDTELWHNTPDLRTLKGIFHALISCCYQCNVITNSDASADRATTYNRGV